MDLSLTIGPWSWRWTFGRHKLQKPIDNSIIEKEFHAKPALTRRMKDNISLWYQLYIDEPPWETDEVKSQGYPGTVVRELTRCTLSESSITVSGSEMGEFLNELMQEKILPSLHEKLELCLALGAVAFKPYIDARGNIFIDCVSPTGFTPTDFDGMGKAIAGTFKEVVTIGNEKYTRLEYHGWDEEGNYTISNRAYRGDSENGAAVSLAVVPKWANLDPDVTISDLEGPLFAYLKNPAVNRIEPESNVGMSVYGGKDNIVLLQKIDRMAAMTDWEYESAERKIFSDGQRTKSSQFMDRLFEFGMFGSGDGLFQEFSPAIRDQNFRDGKQDLLKQLEDNVGLSRGTLSDPQEVQKSATEVAASKDKQRTTVQRIQKAIESAMDALLYAVSAYCQIYGIAPQGDYEVNYDWGDGVINDPATVAAEKATDLQEVSAGLMNDYEYRMKWYKETEEEAKENLPSAEDLADDDGESDIGPRQNPDIAQGQAAGGGNE